MDRRFFIKAFVAPTFLTTSCVNSIPTTTFPNTALSALTYQRAYGRRLIIDGYINGNGPFDFIIDTAATTSLIFENTTTQIEITKSTEQDVNLIGLAGSFGLPMYNVRSFAAGGISLQKSTLPLADDWTNAPATPQGIFGLDFMRDRVTVFSPGPSQLHIFERLDSTLSSFLSSWHSSPITPTTLRDSSSTIFVTEIDIGKKTVPFLLDTGSSATICNYPAVNHLELVPTSPSAINNKTTIQDVHGQEVDSIVIEKFALKIQRKTFSERPLVVSNAEFFDLIGYGQSPFGILGLNHLLQYPIALDLINNRLLIDFTSPEHMERDTVEDPFPGINFPEDTWSF